MNFRQIAERQMTFKQVAERQMTFRQVALRQKLFLLFYNVFSGQKFFKHHFQW